MELCGTVGTGVAGHLQGQVALAIGYFANEVNHDQCRVVHR